MKKQVCRIKLIIPLFIFILLSFSCESGSDIDEMIYVYKTKADYTKNVCVELDSKKTKITSNYAPFSVNTRWPIKLINGYALNGTLGANSGYLSITNDEYKLNYDVSPSPDSLYKLLLDDDPFIEFYEFNDPKNVFYNENGAYGVDTAYINHLIKESNLEKYFIRIK